MVKRLAPLLLTASLGCASAKTAGVVVAVTGVAGALVGSSGLAANCKGGNGCTEEGLVAGGATLGVGVALIGIGLIVYANPGTPPAAAPTVAPTARPPEPTFSPPPM